MKHTLPNLIILLIAAILRLWMLDIKPPHFDEGVNGWFIDQMAHTGYYKYDPTNYHGPLHFYALFISQTLLGRNLWALRLPTILISMASIWLMLRFSRFIGLTAARWAALAMAVSPAFVFYSRYAIHESWLVFFSMLTLYGTLGILTTKQKLRDTERQPIKAKAYRSSDLYLFAAGITGMILTKETYAIHLVCLALAACLLFILDRQYLRSLCLRALIRQSLGERGFVFQSSVLIPIGISLAVIIFFYSGTFMDWSALPGLWQTFAAWFATGVESAGHEKPSYQFGPINYYWLALMARYEWPTLLGIIAGLVVILLTLVRPKRSSHSSSLFCLIALTALGVLAAYSIIPYKTPWCIISILWPFLILFGVAVAKLYTAKNETANSRPYLSFVPSIIIACSLVLAIRLNYFHYTDETEPYVYVQTYEDINDLITPLLQAAKKDASNYGLRGEILLESYFPIPWLLGDFYNLAYYKKDGWPERLTGDFIVMEKNQESTAQTHFQGNQGNYTRQEFRLRSAQDTCVVYWKNTE